MLDKHGEGSAQLSFTATAQRDKRGVKIAMWKTSSSREETRNVLFQSLQFTVSNELALSAPWVAQGIKIGLK